MRAYMVYAPGGPNVLKIFEIPDPEPREGHVLIGIRAFGLNRSELYTRRGHSGDAVPFPRVLGIECVGEVLDGGGSDLTPGQKVIAAMGGMGRSYHGGYAEKTLVPRSQVMAVDTELPWDVLGALPETYFTAWTSLMDEMKLDVMPAKPIIFIRGGTSSVGMAAICIVKAAGGMVIASTRSETKKPKLLDAGADHVVIDRGSLVTAVREIAPDGVHGVLELVGTVAAVKDSSEMIRRGGTLVHTGLLGDEWGQEMPPMPEGVLYTFGNSKQVETEKWTPIAQRIVDGARDGIYKPNTFRTFRFEELVDAHRMMEENRAAGKLVVLTGS